MLAAGFCLSSFAAENSAGPVSLETGEWVLVELAGTPFAASGERRPPTIVFDTAKMSVSGFSGVNRFFGGYERDGEKLKFGPLAGTRMAGPPEDMKTETAFLGALESVSQWRIVSGKLELLRANAIVARFAPAKPAAK
jgi:heat shock protein HslJ